MQNLLLTIDELESWRETFDGSFRDQVIKDSKLKEKEFVKSVLTDKKNALIFRKKITEKEEELLEDKAHLHHLYEKFSESITAQKEWWWWTIGRQKERIKEVEKELKRFIHYHKLCLEKIEPDKELDIPRAKEYPIGDLFISTPTINHGKRRFYCCPFHNEKTASFCWFVEKNVGKCFGCGWYGDSIDFYMKLNNASFKEAVNHLIC